MKNNLSVGLENRKIPASLARKGFPVQIRVVAFFIFKMYRGIVELESLTDSSVLDNMDLVKQHTEHHPEAREKIWHVRKLEIPDNTMSMLANSISKAIKPDWFVLFWDETETYVIFQNKIFLIPRSAVKTRDYSEVKEYALNHGIQEEFFDIQKEIESW